MERSLEIFFKFLDKLDKGPELAGADLSDFLLGKVSDGNEVFSDFAHVLYEGFLYVVFFLELWFGYGLSGLFFLSRW